MFIHFQKNLILSIHPRCSAPHFRSQVNLNINLIVPVRPLRCFPIITSDKVVLMNSGTVEKYGDKEEVLTKVLKAENKTCCKLS